MRARGIAGLATLIVLLVPAALAAPAEAELRVLPPLRLEGDVVLAAPEGIADLPALQRIVGHASRLNITLTREQPSGDSTAAAGPSLELPAVPPEDLLPLGQRDPEVLYVEVAGVEELVFTTWQSGARAVVAVGPYDDGRIRLEGRAADVREGVLRGEGELPATFARAGPRATLDARMPGALHVTGSARALFEGVAIVVQNATTALRIDTTRAADGSGWVAELRATGARLEARAEAPIALRAPVLGFRVDGALHGQRAWGDVRVDDAGQAAGGRPVEARGLLQGDLAPGGGTVKVRAQGELAYLTVGDRRQDFARAAAAGAGLALASALAYYGQHLRFLAIPLYARVAPGELLDNEVRRKVHAHVFAHPGADVKGTAEAVGVSWSTAAYHLARLQREGVMLARRSGRSKRFFVNGNAATAHAEAIAALRNPTALAIAALVARQPGLMQKEIGASLQLPASTVSWHMRRLRALGVVSEQRRWRRAEYAAGEAWADVCAAVAPSPPAGALPPGGASGGVPAP